MIMVQNREETTRNYYCPLAMMIHAAGLVVLSLWAISLSGAFKYQASHLGAQFPSSYTPRLDTLSSVIEYPSQRQKWRKGNKTLFIWTLLSSIANVLIFMTLASVTWIRMTRSYETAIKPEWAFGSFDLDNVSMAVSRIAGGGTWSSTNVDLLISIFTTAAFGSAVEIYVQNCEAMVNRAYWEHLWSLRSTGHVRPETVVEGLGAVSTRPHLAWLAILGAAESWALSNALVIGGREGIQSGGWRSIDSTSLVAIPFFCVITCALMSARLVITLIATLRSPTSSDGLHSFGRKDVWLMSGIADAAVGDKWGALRLPSGSMPGVLGFGPIVEEPTFGSYDFSE